MNIEVAFDVASSYQMHKIIFVKCTLSISDYHGREGNELFKETLNFSNEPKKNCFQV